MDEKHEGKEADKKEILKNNPFTELERSFRDRPMHIAVHSPHYNSSRSSLFTVLGTHCKCSWW